ncbi:MAG: DegT/DnrJ/EryC1/StrS family aminotransferase [Desulfobacteraceae bacterium]|nr:MAG: DegT/DnrJ/EryC1/StrS family aminotransferase [Desulfobacteraceae bacterium]
MKVPFALPECGEAETNEVVEVIKSGWLTTASRAFEFENRFKEFTGAKYCLAVNSCTAALHLGLEALGIKRGDKVIVPVHTFTATAEVLRYLDADPVFVDCDKDTFCISIPELQQKIAEDNLKRQIKAVIPVHFGGHSCDMDHVIDISRKAALSVIEDAAHAFPAFYVSSNENGEEKRRIIGKIGDVTCFSFYANKTITTAEGGMLATDNEAIARRAKVMRLHGIDRDVWDRFGSLKSDWIYDVVAPGFKYNMPDLSAALGIHQLRKANLFREKREKIAQRYYDELSGIDGLTLPKIKCSMKDHAWHIFAILIDSRYSKHSLNRDDFILKMKEKNIGTSVHYIPLHRLTYYRNRYNLQPEMFPNSEWIFQRCVSLPIYSAMTEDQIEYVICSIQKILN